MKKMWYIHVMEYYSGIKRNETGSFVERWVDIDSVILREVSHTEKEKHHISSLICGI